MSTGFIERAKQAMADPQLQRLLGDNYEARQRARVEALQGLTDPAELRSRARAMRQQVVTKLATYSKQFETRLGENGIQVHRATDGPEANRLIVEIARGHGAALVAKSKSMVTEEIGLNEALEAAGIRPVETDLGEFIVQLRGEKPSHILTPALHLSTAQVAESFRVRLGAEVGDDVEQINAAARAHLREIFLKAPVGVSGVNFGVAETGTICLVTNEGNGRMVCTVPPVHIAVMGIERLVPGLDDLAVMLRLLPRFATGQKISSYVTLIHGPRHPSDPDGPSERHLILVDNGRSRLTGTPLAESLLCIRCGSCLNACPVFREAGGHAYGSVYPGPIGAVVSPGLFGFEQYGTLAHASTLCGACKDACPVGIEIPRMLLHVRASLAAKPAARGLSLFTWLARSPTRYRWAQRLAAVATNVLPTRAGWVTRLPGPLAAWSHTRDFPRFARRPLRSRVGGRSRQVWPRRPELEPTRESPPVSIPAEPVEIVDRFEQELRALGGEVIRCSESDALDRIVGELYVLGVSRLLAWGQVEPILFAVLKRLAEEGFSATQPSLPHGAARADAVLSLGEVQVGLTGAVAALAETGTLVLSSGSRRSLLPSLLPEVHLAIVRSREIYADLESWLHAGGSQYIAGSSNLTLISGPSRTADIEMTLTVGVHGPRRLVVFLIE